MRTILLLVTLIVVQPALANVVGPATQNFNSTTDGLDYVTVQSSKTLLPGIVNLGLFINNGYNTLPYLDSSTQSKVKLNDQVLGADFNAGVGIMNRWDAGISFPYILSQKVNDQGDIHGQFTAYGNTEVRVNTKYRLLGEQDGGVALVASMNFNRTSNDPYTGQGSGPTTNFEIVADRTLNKILVSANFGRRFRSPGTPVAGAPIEPLGDQWIYSAAMSYLVTSLDTKLIGEIYGAAPVGSVSPNPTRANTSLEALAGIKHDLTSSLAVHGGIGAGLIRGTASADWRIYAGLNYAFGSVGEGKSVAGLESVPAPPNTEIYRAYNLEFAFDSDHMKFNHAQVLANLIQHLHSIHFTKLIIDGHTDSVGGHAYNMDLSLRRAKTIRDFFIDEHFDPATIEVKGDGPDQPIADNGNYQGRQRNRRVEFTVVH